MKLYRCSFYSLLFFGFIFLIGGSCGKSGTPTPPNPCSGVTVAVSATTSNPSAPGATNGSITATATGGSGFTFSINGAAFQSSGTFSGLAAGAYTVAAKNSNGCTGSSTFTLTAPNPCAGVTITVNGTVVNPTAPGATNGTITVTASGSTGFTFNINGGIFQSSGAFSNLADGNFVIVAKDVNGCTGTASFTLAAPNPCSGITITINGTITNPTIAGGNNGSIVATASGSTGFTYNINGGVFQSSGTFNNLPAGSYTIIAKNVNACTGSAVFTLTNPNPCSGVTITASPSVTGTDPCRTSNGIITVTPGGGTGPFTFQLNSGTFQSSNIFSNLPIGIYSISAKDANSCIGTTANVQILNLPSGSLFNAVRTVLQNNCVNCHNNTTTEGGMNWTVDCNIVTFKDRIQARAVNGTPSSMPPTGLMPASERQKIVDWINAGGKFTD
ncbi:MAG: hypothetical protein ABIP79_10260 [Chitinophagaceae bacterium]